MKPRRGGRRFKAMQRRRRLAGDIGPGERSAAGKPGLAKRIKDVLRPASRPWHRVDYFQAAWEGEDRDRLLHTVAHNLNLYRPGTRRLDPRRVARLNKQRIHASSAFTAYELVLKYRLGKELTPLVRQGKMTWQEWDQELNQFVNDTLPRIRLHVLPEVLETLRRRAGLEPGGGAE